MYIPKKVSMAQSALFIIQRKMLDGSKEKEVREGGVDHGMNMAVGAVWL